MSALSKSNRTSASSSIRISCAFSFTTDAWRLAYKRLCRHLLIDDSTLKLENWARYFDAVGLSVCCRSVKRQCRQEQHVGVAECAWRSRDRSQRVAGFHFVMG